MPLYAACDLHANNHFLAIIDEKGKRVLQNKLPHDPERILAALRPHQDERVGIVVESTDNWYWLVDALMGEGYQVHLAHPSAIQKYSGLQHTDDQHDAFWLAELLRLGILPEGYIDPQEERPIRDLLRKRGHLVRLWTSLIISRNCGVGIEVNDVKRLKEDRISPLLESNEDLALAGRVSKETLDFLTRQIRGIESVVERKAQGKESYRHLLTIPGIGKILA